jgi:cell division inhibitor SepF
MSKLGNAFGKFFDMNDAEEDYDEEVEPAATEAEAQPAPAQPARSSVAPNRSNVVSMNQTAAKGAKIELYEPRIYSDAKEIGRNLLGDTAVLVNFTHLEGQDAKRIVDFMTGVVFAVNGEIKRVGDRIFLVTPANFEVSGTLASKLQDDLNIDDLN